jgi:2-polyprenyl-3-methyl-5-hydroxy-6-metoxy-1,4-benzoquinol methylase
MYPNISYHCEDIFDKPFEELKYDIVLCTLTLHHFKDEEIIKIMTRFMQMLVLVLLLMICSEVHSLIDCSLCFVFQLNNMSRQDGLISILRGFKRRVASFF